MSERWPRVPFRDCLRRVERKVLVDEATEYELVGVRWYGNGAFVREHQLGMNMARKQQWVLADGDVVYNKLFAWKGAFAVADRSVEGRLVSDKFPTYQPVPELVDRRFLAWWFRGPDIARQAAAMSKGAAAISKLTLNPPQFWDLQIPLPPIRDQERIVAKLDAISDRFGQIKQLRTVASEEANHVLGQVTEQYYQSLLHGLDSDVLANLLEPGRGISYGIVLTGKEFAGGVPVVRAGDLRQFEVLTDGLKRVGPHIEEPYRRTRLRGNEVLLKIRGGYGEVAVCPPQLVGANISREIASIPLADGIDPNFAMFMLSAPSVQAQLGARLRGTSYVGVNLKDVRTLRLPVPPMAKQRSVVAHLSSVRKNTETVGRLQAITELELTALMRSVIDRAFKGHL